MLLRNKSEAQTGSAVTDDRDAVDIERGSTDASTIKLCAAHARTNPFDDQRSLKLCYRRNDDDNSSAQRTVRVDSFALGQKLNAEVIQLVEDLKEVFSAAGEAIARPHEDDIEAMTVRVLQQTV
jgi:hypothetical protein